MLDQFTTDELQSALHGAQVGIWSWDAGSDTLRWSSRVGEIYGLEPTDYPRNIEAFSTLLASPEDDLRDQIFEALDQETGRFEFEHQITRRDGLVGWVRNSGRMQFDENNQPQKLVATAIDLTSQKETELSLKTREEQFRRFSELTSDYLYETDMTVFPLVPNVVAGSYERIVGYTATELADKGGWTAIMKPEDLKVGEVVWEQLKAGMPTVHEYRIVNSDGETRWLRDHSRPVLKDGKLVRIIGGVKDITETRTLQDNLLRAQKHEAMARLAGAVAHDFNNLMCVVVASTELMSMEGAKCSPESLQADILHACDRATELTRSLLMFSGNDLPVTQVVRLSDTVHRTESLLQRAVGEQIEVDVECSPNVNDKVEIDPGHIQLVLLNLATNARKAMQDEGKLSFSITEVELRSSELPEMQLKQSVLLEISDTGCGIAEEDFDRIFQPFFTTAKDGTGFGIGLATCQQIIEKAGGTIRVRSQVGQGATFSIYLPTVDKASSTTQLTPHQFTTGGKERILVVEDNSAVRRTSEQALKSHGYEVSTVGSIEAARQEIAHKEFDLVVVDLQLPDGDGCNLVSELQKTAPKLLALLVSGHIDDKVLDRARTAGHNVLPKPYSVKALARSVRTTLQARHH